MVLLWWQRVSCHEDYLCDSLVTNQLSSSTFTSSKSKQSRQLFIGKFLSTSHIVNMTEIGNIVLQSSELFVWGDYHLSFQYDTIYYVKYILWEWQGWRIQINRTISLCRGETVNTEWSASTMWLHSVCQSPPDINCLTKSRAGRGR